VSNAEKQPTGHGPEGCDENGPAAALLVGHVSIQIGSLLAPCRRLILIATIYLLFRGKDTSVARVTCIRAICLASLLLFFEACSVTEQTPEDVGRKFEEGIEGNGKIVPNDKDHSQTGPTNNSPVTQPAGVPQQ
jgi:hypothetical protein